MLKRWCSIFIVSSMKEELVHRPLSETKGTHLQFNFRALGDLESIFQQNWSVF